MNLQLENKLALVNGSTAGIGSAIDKALAAEGVRVTVNGRNVFRHGDETRFKEFDEALKQLEEQMKKQ